MVTPSNAILQIAEGAFLTAIGNVVSGTNVPVLVSDEGEVKPTMPYIVARARNYEELYGPGTGIYKVKCSAIFRSHVKETTPDQREAIVILLNNFTHQNPAATLNMTDGFHCYGFVPTTGQMNVDQETKSYSYDIDWDMFCMPRNNT